MLTKMEGYYSAQDGLRLAMVAYVCPVVDKTSTPFNALNRPFTSLFCVSMVK
jgi:hypothetical protein